MKKQFYFSLLLAVAIIGQYSAQTTFTISTFAGTGTASSTGDGGAALAATFNFPHGVVVDASGNVYVSELSGHKIRKISTSNVVSTFAGTGVAGFGGDGGPAASAQLNQPAAMALDAAGNLYVAEFSGNRIRKITPGGIITTVAGNGTATFAGDGGLATAASINKPIDVKVDILGNLYIADASNNRIRMVNTSSVISTVIGNGTASSTGDGGLANLATVNYPASLYFDASNNLYICELTGNRVRKVNSSGVISTVAGTGAASSTGDGGLATAATLNGAGTVLMDAAGNLLISEYTGARIRSVTSGGIISTVAGTGVAGFSGDGGLATAAQVSGPFQMASAGPNKIYVAEYTNNRIRQLTSACTAPTVTAVSSSSLLCAGQTATITASGANTYTWSTASTNTAIAVSPSVTTSYTVAGTSVSGCIGGIVFTQSVSACTGIDQLSNSTKGIIYPNPNKGEFTIVNADVNSDTHFEIYNAIGMLVMKGAISEMETKIDLTNVNSGIYFVKVLNGTQIVHVQKMVKE